MAVTSQATWAAGSLARMASRIASAIWSQTLSGWPLVTLSEVKTVDLAQASVPQASAQEAQLWLQLQRRSAVGFQFCAYSSHLLHR